MLVYYLILLLIVALAWPLCIYRPARWKKFTYLGLIFGLLWFIATFRKGIGFDYQTYIDIFNKIKSAPWPELFTVTQFEYGFVLLCKLMGLYIESPVVMYGVFELITLVPVVWFIYRYCKDIWLSAWLYVTLTFFYTSMNFIRQSLSCSIALLGYRFLRDKKPVPYFLIVLLAASFHKTALILIPVYFVCHIKLTKKLAIAYASATFILFLSSSLIIDFITDYAFTYYKGSIYIDPKEGFPLIFLVVPFLLFGAFIALRPAWEKRFTEATMLFNMMMYSSIIWLFITRHFILERFSIYVYVFILISVPQALSCLKRPQEEYERREEMRRTTKKGKNEQGQLKALNQNISDHEKYYWSAVAALVLVTLVYHDFGANVNGFHGVFPYRSILPWMNF